MCCLYFIMCWNLRIKCSKLVQETIPSSGAPKITFNKCTDESRNSTVTGDILLPLRLQQRDLQKKTFHSPFPAPWKPRGREKKKISSQLWFVLMCYPIQPLKGTARGPPQAALLPPHRPVPLKGRPRWVYLKDHMTIDSCPSQGVRTKQA